MIKVKSLEKQQIRDLMIQYYHKFKEDAFFFEIPTGNTHLPDITEEELIASLKECLEKNIKLCEIYPSLNHESNLPKGSLI